MSLPQSNSKTSRWGEELPRKKNRPGSLFYYTKFTVLAWSKNSPARTQKAELHVSVFTCFLCLLKFSAEKQNKTNKKILLIDPPEVQLFINVKTISFLARSHYKEKSLISLIPVHKVKQKTTNLIPSVILQKDTF